QIVLRHGNSMASAPTLRPTIEAGRLRDGFARPSLASSTASEQRFAPPVGECEGTLTLVDELVEELRVVGEQLRAAEKNEQAILHRSRVEIERAEARAETAEARAASAEARSRAFETRALEAEELLRRMNDS